ncbi:hypothetical protein [Thioclava electrotropha]|uniref:hypothetical protein n=1 Tax=Thioclava electrotropha TaxID=1549850 RepID=UPI0023A7ABA3|nr:hypothetical protein [Thioclava electrotropha]
MATLLEAVGGDTFGGLSGYRRPTAGNPTKVPTNLPAFRGTPNTPGQKVSAPAIKSSKNRNNRGTNVLIPYSRITTYDGREVGGRLPGDLIFMSAFAPNALSVARDGYLITSTGHDVFHYSRLTGLYGLNQILANHGARNGQGTLMNVYVQTNASKSVADYWYEVPNLNEFRLDGIVLSDDQPGVNHGSTKNELGQLYNISIQGPTPVNNGYVTERGHAMGSRPQPTFSQPPIPVQSREEAFQETLFGERNAKLYKQPAEYTYSEQMFSRDVEPMDELFCALVATKHEAPTAMAAVLAQHDTLVQEIEATLAVGPVLTRTRKRAELKAFIKANDTGDNEGKLSAALRARTVYKAAGVEYDAALALYTFQYHLCTSARLIRLANAGGSYNLARNERRVDGVVGSIMPINHDARNLQGRHTAEVHCDAAWMKRVVGAWRVGTVLDTKATQMPFFEGGPVETGNRLTVNIGVRWLGWRELRRLYTSNPTGVQVGGAFAGAWQRIVQGSAYDPAEAAKRVGTAALEVPDRAVPNDGAGNTLLLAEDDPDTDRDDLLAFQWPATPATDRVYTTKPQLIPVEATPVAADKVGPRVPEDEQIGLERKRKRDAAPAPAPPPFVARETELDTAPPPDARREDTLDAPAAPTKLKARGRARAPAASRPSSKPSPPRTSRLAPRSRPTTASTGAACACAASRSATRRASARRPRSSSASRRRSATTATRSRSVR